MSFALTFYAVLSPRAGVFNVWNNCVISITSFDIVELITCLRYATFLQQRMKRNVHLIFSNTPSQVIECVVVDQ